MGGEKLTKKTEAFLAALLSEGTVAEAARKIGIGETTAWRWMRKTEVKERFRLLRESVLEETASTLQASATRGAQVLLEVAEDQDAPASSRVSAARSLIDLSLKIRESQDFEARLQDVENALESLMDEGKDQ